LALRTSRAHAKGIPLRLVLQRGNADQFTTIEIDQRGINQILCRHGTCGVGEWVTGDIPEARGGRIRQNCLRSHATAGQFMLQRLSKCQYVCLGRPVDAIEDLRRYADDRSNIDQRACASPESPMALP
jgi:hypothetical protein